MALAASTSNPTRKSVTEKICRFIRSIRSILPYASPYWSLRTRHNGISIIVEHSRTTNTRACMHEGSSYYNHEQQQVKHPCVEGQQRTGHSGGP
jgi:hypothetical protein